MLTLLSSILAGLAWVGTHLWVLFLALVPSVMGFLAPVLKATTDALSAVVSAIWQGAKDHTFYAWLLTATLVAISYALGHHYGWAACIDWVHANFKLLARTVPSKWWKLW